MAKTNYLLDTSEIAKMENHSYHLRFRSKNLDYPVLLFLHGGPGNPDRHQIMRCQSPLTNVCTIVAWDQPGSGKAYHRRQAQDPISMDSLTEDAHRVVLYLKQRFGQDKIHVVGHSWGSLLGVLLCQKYPQDIAAFVGIGQFVNGIENERILYDFVLEQARRREDKNGLKRLEKVGFPIKGLYQKQGIVTVRNYLHKYGGAVYHSEKPIWSHVFGDVPTMLAEYSILDLFRYAKGMAFTLKCLDVSGVDFLSSVPRMDVPVFLMLGHHDYNCPFALAEKWLSGLQAPVKRLVWFEQSAHSPQVEEKDRWNETLIQLLFSSENPLQKKALIEN